MISGGAKKVVRGIDKGLHKAERAQKKMAHNISEKITRTEHKVERVVEREERHVERDVKHVK